MTESETRKCTHCGAEVPIEEIRTECMSMCPEFDPDPWYPTVCPVCEALDTLKDPEDPELATCLCCGHKDKPNYRTTTRRGAWGGEAYSETYETCRNCGSYRLKGPMIPEPCMPAVQVLGVETKHVFAEKVVDAFHEFGMMFPPTTEFRLELLDVNSMEDMIKVAEKYVEVV